MRNVSLSALWVNLIVIISGTWGGSFVFVKLITDSMPSRGGGVAWVHRHVGAVRLARIAETGAAC